MMTHSFLFATDASRLRRAEASYNSKNFSEARELVFDFLQKTPHSYLKPEFLLLLSATYLKTGEPDQADVILRGLKGMFPHYEKNPTFQILEASILQSKKNYEAAQRALLDIHSDEALFHSAFLLENTGQSFAAISRLRELEEKYPQSPFSVPGHLSLANSFFSLNEFESAKKSLERDSANLSPMARDLRVYMESAIAYREGRRTDGDRLLADIYDDELSAWGSVLKGIYALKEDDLAAAEIALEKGLAGKEESRVVRSVIGLGEVYFKNNSPEKVVPACNSILSKVKGENRDRILLLRGLAHQKLGRTSEAVQDFEYVAFRKNSDFRDTALLLMGQTLWMDNDYSRLTKGFENLLQEAGKNNKNPEIDSCSLMVADAHFALKHYKEAESLYRGILAKAPPAKLTAQTVSGLSASLVFQKKFADAAKVVDELLVRFGEDREVVRFGLIAQANLSWNEQKFTDAAAKYERFVQMFPQDEKTPLAMFQWGRSYEKIEASSQAFAVWGELRSRFPASPFSYKALVYSAVMADRTGDKETAQKLYGELARGDNSIAAELAFLQLGISQLESNYPLDAIRTLNHFSARFPSSTYIPKAQEAIKEAFILVSLTDRKKLEELGSDLQGCEFGGEAFYHLGLDAMDKGEYEKAGTLFKKVWAEYPLSPSASKALFYQGEADYRAGNFPGAVGVLRQFARQYPHHDMAPLARLRRANALVSLNLFDEAVVAFNEIDETSPQTGYAATALLDMARAYELKSEFPNEIKVYERFLKTFPQDPKANFVCWRLGQLTKREGQYQASIKYYRQVQPAQGLVSPEDLNRVITDLERVIHQGGRPQ